MDLAARRAISELEGPECTSLEVYADPDTPQYEAMIDRIRRRLGLTSLKYQKLDDLIAAIGLPREKVCTFCWNGCERSG
jgi:amidophosphoribosyltransferase